MWNPFKRIKQKQSMKRLRHVSSAVSTLKKLERDGLLHWQVKGKTLLLEQSLAVYMMSQGKKHFTKFLDLVAQYKNAELISDAYEQQRIDLETAAVRKAQESSSAKLTDADIQRVRQNARGDIQHIDISSILNAIHEFDIMIIRSNAVSEQEATQEGGQLVAVGHYDGKKVEMALWDDIKDEFSTQE